MNQNEEHNKMSEMEEQFFQKASVSFDQSKEELWNELEGRLEQEQPKVILFHQRIYRAAAVVVLLMGISSLFLFYKTSHVTMNGEYAQVELPDHSFVKLAPGSELSYYPNLFWLGRSLDLKGQAFFNVEKGSKFSVHSENGITSVLGTSFTINTFKHYAVKCYTGKVRVEGGDSETILTKGMSVSIVKGKHEQKDFNADEFIPFEEESVFYEDIFLQELVIELERRRGVKIHVPVKAYDSFSGYISGVLDVAEQLEIIATTYQLKVTQINDKEYRLE